METTKEVEAKNVVEMEEVAKGVRTGVEGTEEVVMVVEAMAAEETVVKATREEGWEERVQRGWR